MTTNNPNTQNPLHLRVFLASPGDVADERALALQVLERLHYDPLLRGRITVETVAWDKPGAGTPMLATLTPQEAIAEGLPRPADCDIVIVIFWSRMGTPLPEDWKKPDDSPYLSGTEWEYVDALKSAEKQGTPDILVYRRTDKVFFDADDPDFEVKTRQRKLVKQFFQSFSNPDGSIRRGYNAYSTPNDFQDQLNLHLRDRVRKLLERRPAATPSPPDSPGPAQAIPAGPPLWPDSPFPGLRAFNEKDAPIFFGRGAETDGLLNKLADSSVRFLAVVGASGSGKSSLVAAGLLPRLTAGALPGSQDWIVTRFTPGELGDDPFVALAERCKDWLPVDGATARDRAKRLAAQLPTLAEWRDLMLTKRPDWAEWLLFIDQFEELFTLVDSRHIELFVALLSEAAQTARLRVVVTLRADFYHRCVEWQSLAELLRTGSFPLAAPGPGALHEMIARPAELAGLSFDPSDLPQRMLDDTGAEPGALALLAFALAQLYDRRTTADGHLTATAYQDFGGVHGAIGRRAEETLQQLGVSQDAAGVVFQELVDVTDAGAMTRRRVSRARLDRSPDAQRLVDELIKARLLVGGRGVDGQPVVEVAHEKLFTAWPALRKWIDDHREQIQAGKDLEEAAEEWHALGEGGAGLADSIRLNRYRQAGNPSPLAQKFLRAGWRRLWMQRIAGAVAAIVLLTSAGWLQGVGMLERLGPMLIDTLGWSEFKEPEEMIPIPAGKFWMGSADGDAEAKDDEKPRHEVVIKTFELSKYEVTFEEYDLFANATGRLLPSDNGWGRGRQPVINVSWEEAIAYAEWLSRQSGKNYRLPTEAEWEYAARAGTETKRYWGDDLNLACDFANVADESFRKRGWRGEIHACDDGQVVAAKVGSFKPNAFGLYDMLGNVWEWTCSAYEAKYNGQEQQCISNNHASGPRVLRGGSWDDGPLSVRGAARDGGTATDRNNFLGFRLART